MDLPVIWILFLILLLSQCMRLCFLRFVRALDGLVVTPYCTSHPIALKGQSLRRLNLQR